MKRLAGLVLMAASSAAVAAPPPYGAPPETARLAPGPGVEVAEAHCLTCHSADYVSTQPRDFAKPAVFWSGEVAKMRKAYGARLTDEEGAKIVAYLTATYGQ